MHCMSDLYLAEELKDEYNNKIKKLLKMGKLGLNTYMFFIRREKPVTYL